MNIKEYNKKELASLAASHNRIVKPKYRINGEQMANWIAGHTFDGSPDLVEAPYIELDRHECKCGHAVIFEFEWEV